MSSDFEDYIRVIYGWSDVDPSKILKIVLQHNLLQMSDEDKQCIEKWLNDESEDDDLFDDVFNSGLMKRLQDTNEKHTWILYNYNWDGNGEYFGLNVNLHYLARYGEPQFGSLTINQFSLKGLLDTIKVNQSMINLLTKELGLSPTMITFSKQY